MSCTLLLVPRVRIVTALIVSSPCGVLGQSGFALAALFWQKRIVLARWSRS